MFLSFSPPVLSFLCFLDTRSLKNVQTFKLDSQTAANQLPLLSPVSGRVSDDPPSSEHSDWLAESRQGRDRGCGDSASLLMSSLSSWTTGNVTSLLAKMLKNKTKKQRTSVWGEKHSVASGILYRPAPSRTPNTLDPDGLHGIFKASQHWRSSSVQNWTSVQSRVQTPESRRTDHLTVCPTWTPQRRWP